MPARWLIVPFEEIEKRVPKSGVIIDVGCGEGVLATLLAISSKNREIIGIDTNPQKIKLALLATGKIENVTFKLQDALSKNLPKSNAYVLSDFIHHVPDSVHKRLFENLIKNLEKSGVIIIKEIDLEDRLRSKISGFFDFIFYPLQKVYFTKTEDLGKFFKRRGLKVKITKSKQWFPGSTTLIICEK